jgi:homoserine trans-succinylase
VVENGYSGAFGLHVKDHVPLDSSVHVNDVAVNMDEHAMAQRMHGRDVILVTIAALMIPLNVMTRRLIAQNLLLPVDVSILTTKHGWVKNVKRHARHVPN